MVDGRHYTSYTEEVKALKRSGQLEAAEKLLLKLVDATIEEAKARNWAPAPWYYSQLAIIYRKRKDYAAEVALYERMARDGLDTSPERENALYRMKQETAKRQETPLGEPCPYCQEKIVPLPKARRKCPHCKKTVHVRPGSLFRRPLITADEAEIDDEMNNLRHYGVKNEDFWAVCKTRPPAEGSAQIRLYRDVVWSLYNRTIQRLSTEKTGMALYGSLSNLYGHMALYVYREGRSPESMLQHKHEMGLRSLECQREFRPFGLVEIVTAEDPCEECRTLKGMRTSLQDALSQMPLPHKGCTHREGDNSHSFCRCSYRPCWTSSVPRHIVSGDRKDGEQRRKSLWSRLTGR